jgi:hypothetical protein
MAWTYQQITGNFLDPDGNLQGKGYSGQPPRVNDPTAQDIHNVGPCPQGLWQAVELIPESATHGPFAIRLEPYSATVTFGRSGFMMHGDSVSHPGYASDGCIIQSRDVRELFWNSQDHDIQVVEGAPVG